MKSQTIYSKGKAVNRRDHPSGRQASPQPEHSHEDNRRSKESLHQGQGPEFQTQDSVLSEKNEGVKQLKELAFQEQPSKVKQERGEE
jgi:hypothetical protein